MTDFDLAEMSDVDLVDTLHGYLIGAISQFRRCKNDLSNRDDELGRFNADLLDVEKEILAIMMVRQWLQPQLNSVLLTAQVFSDKEQKYYSQSQHISELRALDESLRLEAQKLSRDYTYSSGTYWGEE
jgi:hypothetical protein